MTSLPPVPPETVSAWMQVQTPRLGENAKPYAMAILRFQIDGHMLLSASHEDFQHWGITSVGHRSHIQRHFELDVRAGKMRRAAVAAGQSKMDLPDEMLWGAGSRGPRDSFVPLYPMPPAYSHGYTYYGPQGSTAPAVATASDGVPSEYTKAHEKSSPMQRLMANAKRKHREMTENVATKKDIEKFEMFRGVMKCLLLSCACAAIVVLLMALDAFHKAKMPPEMGDSTAAACGLACNYAKAKTLLKSAQLATPAPFWHWSYTNQDEWAAHYPACGGQMQSPINIVTTDASLIDANASAAASAAGDPSALALRFAPSPPTAQADVFITNDGVRLEMNGSALSASKAVVRGKRYELFKVEFHHPADTVVDNYRAPLEVQLYFHDDGLGDDSLETAKLAVSLRFSAGGTDWNPPLVALGWGSNKVLPKPNDPPRFLGQAAKMLFNLFSQTSAVPYYSYNGSLTQPPCTEGVEWFVLAGVLPALKEQVEYYPKANDSRYDVQPNNGRILKLGKAAILAD